MSKTIEVMPLDEWLRSYKPSWLWRHTPYTGRCLWHMLGYLWRREWREAWSEVHQIKDHTMWYVRAIYRPYNRLRVRNVQRRYSCDNNLYLLHAAFTVLCKHVELGEGGVGRLKERVAEPDAADWPEQSQHWRERFRSMVSLYEWYTAINWDQPVPYPDGAPHDERMKWAEADEKFWRETCKERLMELVSIRDYLWT